MIRGRRVGTFTAGITLVVFGILFLLRLVFPEIDMMVIVPLWPLILVFLGAEILVSYVLAREEKMKYDFGAAVMIIILLIGSFGLAAAEFAVERLPDYLDGQIQHSAAVYDSEP